MCNRCKRHAKQETHFKRQILITMEKVTTKNLLYQKQFPSCHHHKNSTASDYIYRAGLGVLYYQCQMLLYHKKYVGFILCFCHLWLSVRLRLKINHLDSPEQMLSLNVLSIRNKQPFFFNHYTQSYSFPLVPPKT